MSSEQEKIDSTIESTEQDQKKKLSFKEYYHSNTEFKEKHKANMRETIICECGNTTCRGNFAKHIKSKIHAKKLAKKQPVYNVDKLQILENEINQLKNLISNLST
jgi:hypothetical protein